MREIGRLQCPLQNGDCVVLCGDIAEALWTTGIEAWLEVGSRDGQRASEDMIVDVLFLYPGLRSWRV